MKTSTKKNSANLRDVAEDYNNAIVGLCLACGKPVKGGYYSQHEGGGTCNKSCMQVQETKPSYPGHEEGPFLKRFNL